MRLSTPISVAVLLLSALAAAREKKAPNPNLANIHKLFIKGNNEAATEARKRLLLPRDQATRVNCFGLVGNEATADGTLEISQETAPDSAVTASGTLMDRAGNLLWSNSVQGHDIFHIVGPAGSAANGLMSSLEDEICGVPPIIELSKVRKVYVNSIVMGREHLKNMAWQSSCLTFVEYPADADALFPFSGGIGRKGKPIWVLFDPKNNDRIPGWETGPDSFRSVADLERAVGCR